MTKLKANEDDKFSVAKHIISVYVMIENIVKKVENSGYQQFSDHSGFFDPWANGPAV